MNNLPEFIAFPKIPRLQKDCVITEKIDGNSFGFGLYYWKLYIKTKLAGYLALVFR